MRISMRILLLVMEFSLCMAPISWAEDQLHEVVTKNSTWLAGPNKFETMPEDVRKQASGGVFIPDNLDEVRAAHTPPVRSSQLNILGTTSVPVKLDWRDVNGINYVSPIKNQGKCGACVAFGIVGILESAINIQTHAERPYWTPDFNEQYLVSCMLDMGCQGGYLDLTLNKLKVDTGEVIEQYAPYVGLTTACSTVLGSNDPAKIGRYHIDDWYSIPGTVDDLKQALAQYGPLATIIYSTEEFQGYHGGIFNSTTPGGSYAMYHVIDIIGYDDDQQCFFVKNSWGTQTWGEAGFGRISYSEVGSAYTKFGILLNAAIVGARIDPAEPEDPNYQVTLSPDTWRDYRSWNSATLVVSPTNTLYYRYRVDGGSYSADIPVKDYQVISDLTEGIHYVDVLGCDSLGRWATIPTEFTTTVDLTAPMPVIFGISSITSQTTYTVRISGYNIDDCSGYTYYLDNVTDKIVYPFSKQIEFTVGEGHHELRASICDKASNCRAASVEWTVDLSAPIAELATPPDSILTDNGLTIQLASNSDLAYFKYQLDENAWSDILEANQTPSLTLSTGSHTLRLLGGDIVNNWQTTPTTYNFSVTDATAPVVRLNRYPTATTPSQAISIIVGGTGVVAYKYSLDHGAWSNELDIATTIMHTNLAFGNHNLQVIGKNASGIWQTVPTTLGWIIINPNQGVPLAAIQLLLNN